jgi:hypothetical protein
MNNDADRQYNGEFRHVNLGPAQVRRRLGSEQDPSERVALMTALKFWESKKPDREVVAGQHVDCECRNVVYADSISSLAKSVKPVKYVSVRGVLDDHGSSAGIVDLDSESLIDWDMLDGSN